MIIARSIKLIFALTLLVAASAKAESLDSCTTAFWTYISDKSNGITTPDQNPILKYWQAQSKSQVEYVISLDQSVRAIEAERLQSKVSVDIAKAESESEMTLKIASEVVRNIKIHLEIASKVPPSEKTRSEKPIMLKVMKRALWLRAYSEELLKLVKAIRPTQSSWRKS